MEFWAKVIVVSTSVQALFTILMIREYRFMGAVLRATEIRHTADECEEKSGRSMT